MAQTARIQVIHNSADAAAEVVDVYINDVLSIPDFTFRTATPFIDVPAGVSLDVQIAPGNSMSSAEAIATFNYNLTADETYIIVANGIVSAEGYSPATGFDLHVYPMAREMAMTEGNTDVLVFHGATDAPVVDVYEAALAEATIVDDMAYAEFRGYLELPTENYVLHVKDETGSVVVASYDAPLAALELQNQALIVLASGFLNPANNSDGEAFGLYVALADGGSLVQLPLSSPMGIEQYSDVNFSIYPNPVSDVLNISLDNDFGNEVSVNIYNGIGQIVESKSFYNENNVSMNIESLTNGTYYLILNSDTGIIKSNIQVIR